MASTAYRTLCRHLANHLRLLKTIVFIASGVCCVSGLLLKQEPCPKHVYDVHKKDFNISNYLGTWYTYAKYPNTNGSVPECLELNIYKKRDSYFMRARYRDESSKKPAGTLLELVDVDMTGHFRTYPAQKGFKMGLNTWIIETDYRSYAVRFSCSAAEQGGSYQMAVILTRKRLPPHSTVAEAKRKAFRARIPMIPMKLVNQRNCWNL